jgi:hypothetical protein
MMGVNRVIFINSIGIYDQPLKAIPGLYCKGAEVYEQSSLNYTILRLRWFSKE